MPSACLAQAVVAHANDRRACASIVLMVPDIIGSKFNPVASGAFALSADVQKNRLRKGRRGEAPPRFDAEAYKGRNVVERAINRLKDFRAVATRYEKRGHNCMAAVTIATIIL